MASMSLDIKALGAIKTDVVQRPTTQSIEMSCEDFLWITRTISGMSHKGRITAAHKPIVFTKGLLTGPPAYKAAGQAAAWAWPQAGLLSESKKFN